MMEKIRVAGIYKGTMSDGPGIRNVIFFQGCDHRCDGCHNPETWSHDGGKDMSIEEILSEVLEPEVDITISGGDPIYQLDGLVELCKRLKERGKNIWVYTGFSLQYLIVSYKFNELLKYINALVDGKYIKTLKPVPFRGSSNQRIHMFEDGKYIGQYKNE